MMEPMTIGKYLIQRLQEQGLKHVFGIPGDYILGFYDLLSKGPLRIVGTCTEAGAGFAADLVIHRRTEFLSPAYYTSMGFAVPAAVGAQIRSPRLRPVVFVGDGAFQMTGQELSTVVRYGLNPIVFVLNNKGYTTERLIQDGPYNDIHDWAYHLWPEILREGWGCEVRLEGELEAALVQARRRRGSFSLINVHLDPLDRSDALERLGRRLARQAGLRGAKRKHG